MLSRGARSGAFFMALFALAAAGGCLFAPDRCADLLQCGKGAGGTGAGGSGGDAGGASSSVQASATSSTGIPFTPCANEDDCVGTPRPTCDMATHQCRDCSTEDCRVPLGGKCAIGSACVSGFCAMGECAACMTGDQCTTPSCVMGACKAPTGAPCGSNGDCSGGECRFGLCRANIGHFCTVADECFNGVCQANACQACFDDVDCPGTACGVGKELGRCLLPPGAGCWPDSQMIVSCFNGTCAGFPPTCQ
ncbi:MAG: hypothetical protein ABJE95_23625 [Byssovorax sp.]